MKTVPVLLLAAVLASWAEPSAPPVQDSGQQRAYHTTADPNANKNPARDHAPPVDVPPVKVEVVSVQRGEEAERADYYAQKSLDEAERIRIATVCAALAAWATAGLAFFALLFSACSWIANYQAARRQLRAYVKVTFEGKRWIELRTSAQGTRYFRVRFTLTNMGQTPAREIVFGDTWRGGPPGQDPVVKVFDFPSQTFSLGIGERKVQAVNVIVPPEELDQMLRGDDTKNLYLLGHVHYRDIFNDKRITEFGFDIEWSRDGGWPPSVAKTKSHNRET